MVGSMKNKRYKGVLYAVMAGYAIFVLPAAILLMFSMEWLISPRVHELLEFPEGTQILQEYETKPVKFFGEECVLVVAQIPPDAAEEFGEEMQWGLWPAPPSRRLREVMADVEGVPEILDSERLLWKYYVISSRVVEGPHKDYRAEVYDPETGIYCYVERRK